MKTKSIEKKNNLHIEEVIEFEPSLVTWECPKINQQKRRNKGKKIKTMNSTL